MWVMTSWGVLMPSQRPAGTVPTGDDCEMQIRTRRRVELERVCQFYPELGLKVEDIIFMDHTDYEYRIHCTRDQLARLMDLLSRDINYTKFKPSTEKFGESKLHGFYNRVWGVYYDMFSTNRYLEQKVVSTGQKAKKRNRHHQDQPIPPRKHWWEDTDRTERTENF